MLPYTAQGRGTLSRVRGLLLLPLLMVLLVTFCAAQSEKSQENQGENNTGSTESPETVSSDVAIVSPRNSWLVFRHNSNKGENKKTKPPKRASKHGLPGPPGPPGPQGPPGPPAPLLPQQEELMQEFQLRLREMAGGPCLLCERPPRVATAFHCRLHHPLTVPRRSLLELQPFSSVSDTEQSLQRGQGFNSSSGRYTAPVSGFYQLTASLLIEPNERSQARMKDSVKASICIESLCQSNVSLDSVTGVGSSGVFSILLTGTLYIQAGEYVSIFVDNGTGSALTVLQDTLFSGILLGV
ncbi:erythroferrone [Oncorhynchus tshawytscha]|uniref:Adipolin n=4 Tax=Salmoninae TaxID=504568 RepID=A0A8C7N7I0_ONCKI|nr:erythroferrone [Oncorhynchus kisutch]XP_024290791.1 erythroferrone [Oncorhynchus tshawytscha]